MGNCSSKNHRRNSTEQKSIQGLLPIGDLAMQNYVIENLVFASGSTEGYSYAGAMKALEKLCLLQGIKRFAGVGTGAIAAALLALGFCSKEILTAFNEYRDNVLFDDQGDDFLKNFVKNYGCNSGAKFLDWFGRLLKSKSFSPEVSFLEFYEKTGKELCVVVTNVDKLVLEYCHPKTTPDLPIKVAVLMSLSTPGIFAPIKYGPRIEKYHYVSGSLMCNYPIHSFDGWWLSMDAKDSILNQLDTLDQYLMPDKLFDHRNGRTLGFFHISKHQETIYKEFVDRLLDAGADLQTPRTALGTKYNTASQKRLTAVEKFSRLRKACKMFLLIADELEDEGKITLDCFAWNIYTLQWISQDDWVLFFPEFGSKLDDLKSFLSSLVNRDYDLTKSSLRGFLQNKLLSLLDDFSGYFKNRVINLHTYFNMVFGVLPYSAKILAKSDYDRSVGILCGHVGGCDIDLDEADQKFLYRQGWNATVSYFRQIDKRNR